MAVTNKKTAPIIPCCCLGIIHILATVPILYEVFPENVGHHEELPYK